jgi:protein disulfide-isomerase
MKKYLGAIILTLMLLIPNFTIALDTQWSDNLDQAKIAAQTGDKYIFVNFSGSDWCYWCKKLEKEVLNTVEFKKFAADNLVLVSIDFPKRIKQTPALKQRNEELASKYAIRGFPSVVIMAADGEVIKKTGYRQGGSKAYVAYVEDILNQYRASN